MFYWAKFQQIPLPLCNRGSFRGKMSVLPLKCKGNSGYAAAYEQESNFRGLRWKLRTKFFAGLFIYTCLNALILPCYANPVLNNIGSGNVSIQQSPDSTVINQSSQKAIIHWNSFNINQNESTHFQQPAGGITLNRISPIDGASQIYGVLTATGRIILINPAGIHFGPSAYVNVGGLVASTANISDKNFLNGSFHFDAVPSYSGSVINEGQIIAANHGLVALIGSSVSNTGLIQANLGHIVLVSGSSFTMSFAGNDLISFAVDGKPLSPKPGNHGRSNTGTLIANGGSIIISANAASGVLDNVINMQNIAQARSIYRQNGELVLSSDPNANVVRVAANLDRIAANLYATKGKTKGERVGQVEAAVELGASSNRDGSITISSNEQRGSYSSSTLPATSTLSNEAVVSTSPYSSSSTVPYSSSSSSSTLSTADADAARERLKELMNSHDGTTLPDMYEMQMLLYQLGLLDSMKQLNGGEYNSVLPYNSILPDSSSTFPSSTLPSSSTLTINSTLSNEAVVSTAPEEGVVSTAPEEAVVSTAPYSSSSTLPNNNSSTLSADTAAARERLKELMNSHDGITLEEMFEMQMLLNQLGLLDNMKDLGGDEYTSILPYNSVLPSSSNALPYSSTSSRSTTLPYNNTNNSTLSADTAAARERLKELMNSHDGITPEEMFEMQMLLNQLGLLDSTTHPQQ